MKKKNETYSAHTGTFQSLLRPVLTPVLRNRDYDRLVADLRQLDDNLTLSGLETLAMSFALSQLPQAASLVRRNKRAEFGKTAPGEGDKLIESVQRQQSLKRQQELEWAVADRGFDGAATREALQAAGVSSHICPKSPPQGA